MAPGRALWSIAWPVIAFGLVRTGYFLADSFWAGRLPRDAAPALSALGAIAFAWWILTSLGELSGVGTHALVARAAGGGREERIPHLLGQGVLLAAAMGLLLAALANPLGRAYFALIGFQGAEFGPALHLGRQYLGILLAGSLPLLVHVVTDAVFRGIGDTRTPMAIAAAGLLLNAALDPVLMFGWGGGPALGLAGAAWATVIASVVALSASMYALARRGYRPRGLRPDPRVLARIARIGSPHTLSGTGFCLIYVALGPVINRFGPAAMAGLGLGHRVESVAFTVALGYAAAAATLVGQNLGAGDPAAAHRAARLSARGAALWMVPFGVIALGASGPIMALFTSDPEAARHGAAYLAMAGAVAAFMAWEIAYEGAFAGAGDTLPAMAITLPLTAARIPLAYAAAFHTPLGAAGIWCAIGATTVAKGVALRTAWARRHGRRGITGSP
ncbi:MATE family efflux transporter [Myxococcota bacterium]|nr:MATE family efflux transporter [Myxococcota bacterium]